MQFTLHTDCGKNSAIITIDAHSERATIIDSVSGKQVATIRLSAAYEDGISRNAYYLTLDPHVSRLSGENIIYVNNES